MAAFLIPGFDVRLAKDLDGAVLITSDDASEYWDMLQPGDAWKKYFWQGGIDTLGGFIRYLCRPAVWPFFISDATGPAAMVVLTDVSPKAAQAHFAFSSRFWGKSALRLGRAVLEMLDGLVLANGIPKFWALWGETPDNNSSALGFVSALGFIPKAVIPYAGENFEGKPGNLVISYRLNPYVREEVNNG